VVTSCIGLSASSGPCLPDAVGHFTFFSDHWAFPVPAFLFLLFLPLLAFGSPFLKMRLGCRKKRKKGCGANACSESYFFRLRGQKCDEHRKLSTGLMAEFATPEQLLEAGSPNARCGESPALIRSRHVPPTIEGRAMYRSGFNRTGVPMFVLRGGLSAGCAGFLLQYYYARL